MYRDAADVPAKKSLKDNVMEEWTAYMVVRTCDPNKYVSVMQPSNPSTPTGLTSTPALLRLRLMLYPSTHLIPSTVTCRISVLTSNVNVRQQPEQKSSLPRGIPGGLMSPLTASFVSVVAYVVMTVTTVTRRNTIPRPQWWIRLNEHLINQPGNKTPQVHQQTEAAPIGLQMTRKRSVWFSSI